MLDLGVGLLLWEGGMKEGVRVLGWEGVRIGGC